MAFDWRMKRKLIFFGFFAVIVFVIAGVLTYVVLPAPSCTDGKINQGEELVDCGGPNCAPCITEQADDLIVLWPRFFEVRPGVYDIAALVKNVNLTLGSSNVSYRFELFDDRGDRIVFRTGETYILPNKEFLVFEANVETGIRTPVRVAFEIEEPRWRLVDQQVLPVHIARTERDLFQDRPRIVATLANSSLKDVSKLDVAVIVSDSDGNAVGVAETFVEQVPDSGTAEAAFTWPHPFRRTPADVRFIVRQRPTPSPF